MSDTEELKAKGYLEYREMVAAVAKLSRVHPNTLRDWLATPLAKVRSMLVKDGLIIEPDDRTWACLYSSDLVITFVAYVRWHNFGGRHSVAQVVRFFDQLERGDRMATGFLPPRLRPTASNEVDLGTTAVSNVVSITRTA